MLYIYIPFFRRKSRRCLQLVSLIRRCAYQNPFCSFPCSFFSREPLFCYVRECVCVCVCVSYLKICDMETKGLLMRYKERKVALKKPLSSNSGSQFLSLFKQPHGSGRNFLLHLNYYYTIPEKILFAFPGVLL